jgi:hypothetical protein
MVGRSATTDERLDACRRGQSMSGGHDEQLYPASPFVSRQGGRLRSDWVAAFDRNRWPPSAGIGGHFASDSADATGPVAVDEMGRSAQTFHNIAGRMIVGPVPFANLRAMMARAETALESFSPDEVNGWAGKELDLQIGPRRLAFTSETSSSRSRCPISIFTPSPPTTSCARRACRSENVITRDSCAPDRPRPHAATGKSHGASVRVRFPVSSAQGERCPHLADCVKKARKSQGFENPGGLGSAKHLAGHPRQIRYPATRRVASATNLSTASPDSLSERCKTAVWASASIEVTHTKAARSRSIVRSSSLCPSR